RRIRGARIDHLARLEVTERSHARGHRIAAPVGAELERGLLLDEVAVEVRYAVIERAELRLEQAIEADRVVPEIEVVVELEEVGSVVPEEVQHVALVEVRTDEGPVPVFIVFREADRGRTRVAERELNLLRLDRVVAVERRELVAAVQVVPRDVDLG